MPKRFRIPLLIFVVLFLPVARAAAFDWDPVSDQEKQLNVNPLDPGSGALVIFKRGEIDVQQPTVSFWATRILTYTRIKILNDSGRDAGNVVLYSPKFLRLSKIEGRTILPSGEIVPLDTSKVFHGVAYQEGKNFAELTTSFAFSSVQTGAIIEYQTDEEADWFYSPPWIFDTRGLATLDSSLRTVISPNMEMAQLPLETTLNKITMAQKRTVLGVQTDYHTQYMLPIRDEPFSMPFRDRAVMLMLNPFFVTFSGQAIPIITKWDDVGKQVLDFVMTMNKTNKETVSKAKELAEKIPDPHARAQAIYRYLQENVTSSNLAGIGLNRTADEVITGKRADPDDINAVFFTMLKEEKVDADLVMVATHNWQGLTDKFPNLTEFARLIVRINFKDGPVFADAADAGASFGELPWFEKGLTGMAIKGNKLQVKVAPADIPAGTPDDNLSTSKFNLKLDSNWKAEGDVEMNIAGSEAIKFRGNVIGEAPAKVQQTLTDYLGFGHGDAVVSNLTHPDFQDTTQAVDIKAHVEYPIADQTGPGELLLNPWMGDAYRSPVFKSAGRQSFVQFESPEKLVTTSTWTLPLDVQVEKLPDAVNMQGDVADFSHSCTQTANTITCMRTFTQKKTTMTDPHGYPSMKKFFDEVAQHDQEVILLRKQ